MKNLDNIKNFLRKPLIKYGLPILAAGFLATKNTFQLDGVPSLEKYGYHWEDMLSSAIEIFKEDNTEFNGKFDDIESSKNLATGYGLLIGVCAEFAHKLDQTGEYKSAVHKIMQNPDYRKKLFNWAEPQYIKAFSNLDSANQNIYLEVLKHTKEYLQTFDYPNELEFYNQCKKQDQRNDFARTNPKGKGRVKLLHIDNYLFGFNMEKEDFNKSLQEFNKRYNRNDNLSLNEAEWDSLHAMKKIKKNGYEINWSDATFDKKVLRAAVRVTDEKNGVDRSWYYYPCRKMEAWCFRRIHEDGVPLKELQGYINQIEKDLNTKK